MEIDHRLIVNFLIDYQTYYRDLRYTDTPLILTEVYLDPSILPIGAFYQNMGIIHVVDDEGYISSLSSRNEESVDQYGLCIKQVYSDCKTNTISEYNAKQEKKFNSDNDVLFVLQDIL